MLSFDPQAPLPNGLYQVEIEDVDVRSITGFSPITVALFRLTEPTEDQAKEGHPQTGLGGRAVAAAFQLDDPNPATKAEDRERLSGLLNAVGESRLDEAVGCVLWVRCARAVSRIDPSRYQTIAVEFLPLDYKPREFVE